MDTYLLRWNTFIIPSTEACISSASFVEKKEAVNYRCAIATKIAFDDPTRRPSSNPSQPRFLTFHHVEVPYKSPDPCIMASSMNSGKAGVIKASDDADNMDQLVSRPPSLPVLHDPAS